MYIITENGCYKTNDITFTKDNTVKFTGTNTLLEREANYEFDISNIQKITNKLK